VSTGDTSGFSGFKPRVDLNQNHSNFMAKFNPTITAYLVPYIREGYNKKFFLLGESTS